jgi:hypothetical protein
MFGAMARIVPVGGTTCGQRQQFLVVGFSPAFPTAAKRSTKVYVIKKNTQSRTQPRKNHNLAFSLGANSSESPGWLL